MFNDVSSLAGLILVAGNGKAQAYAAAKVRDYLNKPAVHETMVKVSSCTFATYFLKQNHMMDMQMLVVGQRMDGERDW